MLAQFPLLDPHRVARLQHKFHLSMRRLLHDLCDELDGPYRVECLSCGLPVSYFRLLEEHFDLQAYGEWTVVGWVEELNDLVYFLDLGRQLRHEHDRRGFVAALFAECDEQFYEHEYRDELFPQGRPEVAGLTGRLRSLCNRLARKVLQQALFLAPELSCRWIAMQRRSCWEVSVDLGQDFEWSQQAGHLSGAADISVRLPASVRRRLSDHGWQGTLVIREADIRLRIGREERLLATRHARGLTWCHPVVRPHALRLKHAAGTAVLTLGPTLVYGRGRNPVRVTSSSARLAGRVQQALTSIEQVWPEGSNLVALLTLRVVPLHARGVVSFSYRNRPGLSFINLFDRNRLDLIDDLIHENSHHHLNLLLREHVFYRGDRNQEIFYSPWRRSLRPLRGILHATFTFTMGAILFERLSAFKGRPTGREARSNRREKGQTWLTDEELLRARARCLEEIDSVRYSLRDLDYAAQTLGWITVAGKSLVESLRQEITRVRQRIAPCETSVLRSRYGSALQRHRRELADARKIYGPR